MKTKILLLLINFPGVWIYSQSNITYDGGTGIEIQSGADVCADAIVINGTYTGSGTICQGALPVTMRSFTAAVTNNNIKLDWITEIELNNSGFEVERRTTSFNPPEGETSEWKRIAFISGNGTTNDPKSYTYEDKKLQTGSYKYRLKQIDFNGNYEFFEIQNNVIVKAPGIFSISQNYPNPSNPKSRIEYQIPATGKVSLKVFDILGKETINLVDETKEAGFYVTEFDGSNLASGVYFYSISVEGNGQRFSKTLKMILVK